MTERGVTWRALEPPRFSDGGTKRRGGRGVLGLGRDGDGLAGKEREGGSERPWLILHVG